MKKHNYFFDIVFMSGYKWLYIYNSYTGKICFWYRLTRSPEKTITSFKIQRPSAMAKYYIDNQIKNYLNKRYETI